MHSSIPTIALGQKSSSARMDLALPWEFTVTADGARTRFITFLLTSSDLELANSPFIYHSFELIKNF